MNIDLVWLSRPKVVKMAFMLAFTLVATTSLPHVTLASSIAIVVNDTAITTIDIQRRSKLLSLQRAKGDLKKKAREDLIEDAIKMNEARRLGAVVSDRQVNQSFARFASSNKMSVKQMSQMLSQAGVGASHFKEFIRVQMSWPRVVGARFNNSGQMSTEDLVSKMLERGGEKPTTTEYILQQVIFVVPTAKRKSILNKRKREAEAMRARFVNCESTRDFAKGLKDVSVRDLGRVSQPNGKARSKKSRRARQQRQRSQRAVSNSLGYAPAQRFPMTLQPKWYFVQRKPAKIRTAMPIRNSF